jgi:trk system potassium uptake protein
VSHEARAASAGGTRDEGRAGGRAASIAARWLGPMSWLQVGALLGVGPGMGLALTLRGDSGSWLLWCSLALALLSAGGAISARRWPLSGRVGVSAAWGVAAALVAQPAAASPLWALLLALGVGWGGVWVWNLTASPPDGTRDRPADLILGGALGGAAVWAVALLTGMRGWLPLAASVGAAVTCWALLGRWLWSMGWLRGRRGFSAVVAALGFMALCCVLLPMQLWAVALFAPVWVVAVQLHRRASAHAVRDHRALSLFWELMSDPARSLVATFLLIGLSGGVLLASPLCATGEAASLLDAMFTAFSAACVTGLAVLDTGGDFSFAGQAVILALIQIGGLGIMTFSTAGLALLGKRISLRHEATMAELLSLESRRDLNAELRRILSVTFGVEAVGAALLTLQFAWAGEPWAQALWRGVFTSISAFCNAGFALQGDSLMSYQRSPWVLHTIGLIIIAGSFGPAVVLALPALVRGRCRALHVRVVWRVTLWLLCVPAALIFAWEAPHTLASLGWFDAVTNAWFQSVTLRTAGFNSIDLAAVQPATLSLMMALMFIGGSPGSTAGGLKTTNVALMLAALRANLSSHDAVRVLGYSVPRRTVQRSFTVGFIGLLSGFALLLLLQLTHAIPLHSAMFESISALATVGLSIGATADLDSVGKIAIILAMFAGRVGPLTLFMVLAMRQPLSERTLPEQDLPIG